MREDKTQFSGKVLIAVFWCAWCIANYCLAIQLFWGPSQTSQQKEKPLTRLILFKYSLVEWKFFDACDFYSWKVKVIGVDEHIVVPLCNHRRYNQCATLIFSHKVASNFLGWSWMRKRLPIWWQVCFCQLLNFYVIRNVNGYHHIIFWQCGQC